jgi:hypothetical protein
MAFAILAMLENPGSARTPVSIWEMVPAGKPHRRSASRMDSPASSLAALSTSPIGEIVEVADILNFEGKLPDPGDLGFAKDLPQFVPHVVERFDGVLRLAAVVHDDQPAATRVVAVDAGVHVAERFFGRLKCCMFGSVVVDVDHVDVNLFRTDHTAKRSAFTAVSNRGKGSNSFGSIQF